MELLGSLEFRLTPKSYKIGLAESDRMKDLENKTKQTNKMINFYKSSSYDPNELNVLLESKGSSLVSQSGKLSKILSRPNIYNRDLMKLPLVSDFISKENIDSSSLEQAEIQIKYSGYIEKEKQMADKINRLDKVAIPKNFNYNKLASLSNEAKEKLNMILPETLSQAGRISGINPSDLSVLLVALGR